MRSDLWPKWACGRNGPVAEMGLSARTHENGGHCSNAGGLSAVLRDPLYRNGRIHVFAANAPAACILDTPHSFPEPCGRPGHQPSPKHILEGLMKDVVPIPSTSPVHVAPARCPTCHSSAIVTTAKSPDADTYWRCTRCGEIWNASRSLSDRHGAYRWR